MQSWSYQSNNVAFKWTHLSSAQPPKTHYLRIDRGNNRSDGKMCKKM